MSAYLCNPEHIGLLAAYLAISRYEHWAEPDRSDFSHRGARTIAEALAAENIRSVSVRYPGDKSGGRPGLSMHDSDITELSAMWAAHYADTRRTVSAVTVLRLLQCLEYQSCEAEDYLTTEAAGYCTQIRDAAIRKLPGYEDGSRNWQDLNIPMSIAEYYDKLEGY